MEVISDNKRNLTRLLMHEFYYFSYYNEVKIET